ncbi:mechanosensitive ion channel [Alloiococcus sp. CFN-8]|uniref:mechanosensitive ion channel n=1 Tax=Alloiococcus sp. CFN-8 TaxID=3416081 RepID=UPI003CF15BE8
MRNFFGLTDGFYVGFPRFVSAILLLLLALVVALIAKAIVVNGGKKIGLTKLFDKWGLSQNNNPQDMLNSIGRLVFWIVFILFLPGVLDSLTLSSVSQPFSQMASKFLGFLPNLLGAVIIVVVGSFVARIIRSLLAAVLKKLKVDELQQKAGIEQMNDSTSFSQLIANIVFILIWIPIIISALEVLNITAISRPAILMLNIILSAIPRIFAAAVIIIIGIYAAKLVGNFVSNLLSGLGLDSLYEKIGLSNKNNSSQYSPSKIIGGIVQFIIILLFAVEGLSVINLRVLNTVGLALIGYLPHIIAAIIILGVGIFLGVWAEGLITKYTNVSSITAMTAKWIIVFFAIFMTLNQLGIAMVVVNTAFMMILGALSVAFAIAFGVGGRDFAKRSLEKFEKKLQNAPAAKDHPMTKKSAEMAPDPMQAMNNMGSGGDSSSSTSNSGTDNNKNNENNSGTYSPKREIGD